MASASYGDHEEGQEVADAEIMTPEEEKEHDEKEQETQLIQYGTTDELAEREQVYQDAKGKPKYYRVVTSLDPNRVLFRSVSRVRAMNWLQNRSPRGSDLCMQTPTGQTFSYEQERLGANGLEVPKWKLFDPETEYSRPDKASEIAPDEWADVEVA
jgi:hypothetical protein